MWSTLFSWPVIGAVASMLVGAGVSLLSMVPPAFDGAKACLTIAVALFLVKTATWLVAVDATRFFRLTAAVVILSTLGISWVATWKWIDTRERQPAPPADTKQSSATPQTISVASNQASVGPTQKRGRGSNVEGVVGVPAAVSEPQPAPSVPSFSIVIAHNQRWQNANFRVDDQPALVADSSLRFTKLIVSPGAHTLLAVMGTEKCSARFSAPVTSPVALGCD